MANTHKFTPLMTAGRSLHPLQRLGHIAAPAGMTNKPAATPSGIDAARQGVRPTPLGLPPSLSTSISSATNRGNV